MEGDTSIKEVERHILKPCDSEKVGGIPNDIFFLVIIANIAIFAFPESSLMEVVPSIS